MRNLHWADYESTLCGTGSQHDTTDDIDEVSCVLCARRLLKKLNKTILSEGQVFTVMLKPGIPKKINIPLKSGDRRLYTSWKSDLLGSIVIRSVVWDNQQISSLPFSAQLLSHALVQGPASTGRSWLVYDVVNNHAKTLALSTTFYEGD